MTSEADPAPPPSGDPRGRAGVGGGVMHQLRDGWHALGGGDAESCPGCPVCRVSESAARMDPVTAEHLQQAVGHLVAAGRELLAALAPTRPGDATTPDATTTDPTTTDPPGPSPGARTRIPVSTTTQGPDEGPPPRGPAQGHEQHEEQA